LFEVASFKIATFGEPLSCHFWWLQ